MSRNVIGIALALTIIGCLAVANSATAEGPKLQSGAANSMLGELMAAHTTRHLFFVGRVRRLTPPGLGPRPRPR